MVSDAAEVLLKDWPKPRCDSRLAAIEACLADLRGEGILDLSPNILVAAWLQMRTEGVAPFM
ncbi:DUF982 domain-containing protein [Mesorhizobium sp. M0622]|uniref:DUF982 domain-containing protein n=1 Tax=unclassified Mesorhizobium TaxID=325217 RepID=UPI0033376362